MSRETAGVFGFAAQEDDLIEVEVDESNLPADDDDEGSVFSDMEESVGGDLDGDGDAGPDMAHAIMTKHTDCVYVSAIHPTQPNIVLTGGGDDRAYLWTYDPITPTGASSNEEMKDGDDTPPATTEERVQSCIELGGHSDTVTAVGFNFDGSTFLTGAYDGTIRTWDTATGELKLVIDGPEDIEWAQWHSKGNAIVAGSKDGTIWMWLAHDGQCVQVFAGHDGGVSTGCFTSDGKLICSGGEDGSVRVWAPKTGACKQVFNLQHGHDALVTCMASSTIDADLLISGKYYCY